MIPKRFERLTHSLEGCCSIQLSYGTIHLSGCKVKHFFFILQEANKIKYNFCIKNILYGFIKTLVLKGKARAFTSADFKGFNNFGSYMFTTLKKSCFFSFNPYFFSYIIVQNYYIYTSIQFDLVLTCSNDSPYHLKRPFRCVYPHYTACFGSIDT